MLVTCTSETIYASIGEDVLVQCPNVRGADWLFSKPKEILAQCSNGKNKINPNIKRFDRLNISETCSLQIQNFTRDDVGLYTCFRLERSNSSEHSNEKEFKLRSKFFIWCYLLKMHYLHSYKILYMNQNIKD